MTLPVDKAIRLYVQLRDQRDEMEAAHKQALAPLKEQMDLIERALHVVMQQQGSDKIAAAGVGTAYTSEVLTLKATDKAAVWSYVTANDRPDLLQWSINKTAFRGLEEDGLTLPGVEVSRAIKVNVRRA